MTIEYRRQEINLDKELIEEAEFYWKTESCSTDFIINRALYEYLRTFEAEQEELNDDE